MTEPILYGPSYSTYVRTARLCLEEKGVNYQLVEVDFLKGGMPAEHLERHPFGKVPAFTHDGFDLYETCAIARYVDEAFSGPSLQPEQASGRARMTQLFSIIDAYTYGPTIGQLVIQRVVTPMLGGTPDEAAVAASQPAIGTALAAISNLAGSGPWLAGHRLSLSDLHLAPIFAYFTMTPESGPILERFPVLQQWWETISKRDSMLKTEPQFG